MSGVSSPVAVIPNLSDTGSWWIVDSNIQCFLITADYGLKSSLALFTGNCRPRPSLNTVAVHLLPRSFFQFSRSENNIGDVIGEKKARKTLMNLPILPFSRFSEQHIAIFFLSALRPLDSLFCQSVWVTDGQYPLQVGESAMFTLSIFSIGVIFGGKDVLHFRFRTKIYLLYIM